MSKITKIVILSGLLSGQAFSANIPAIMEKISVDSNDKSLLASKGLTESHDDVYESQDVEHIVLSKEQKHHAEVWGLTEQEEQRFIALMDNKSGIYYKGLRQTPLDILGTNARTDEERVHFAKISSKMELEKVARELAWNTTFHNVSLGLTKDIPVINDFDTKPYSPYSQKLISLSIGDELHLFTSKKDSVKIMLSALVEAVRTTPNTKLSIYITDATSQEAQDFANKQSLPYDLVSEGKINISVGGLEFDGLNIQDKKMPLMVLTKDGASSQVNLGDLQ
tara:strand:+ start:231 stop:1070 length:840 start_codon:yes stop_codon:yes gene_type:complete